jgi:hypothetical protein
LQALKVGLLPGSRVGRARVVVKQHNVAATLEE